MFRSALLVLAALGLSAAAPRDWSRDARESSAGWSFGKTTASAKLTEYLSFGCPHCGHFAAEAGPAIHARVKAGMLRYDVRPFLIFPEDRAAAALTRCVPAPKRLAFIEALYTDQRKIKAALAAADADDAQRGALYRAELIGPEAHAAAIAKAGGLDQIAIANGLPADRVASCLADPANQAWITQADLEARIAGVKGTPTFELGGQRLPQDLTPAQLTASLSR